MFKKQYLRRGILVVMEQIEGVRSVSLGIWVKAGSRYESSGTNGIYHFLEHMFFKGTWKRSQKEIAFEIDSLGGDMNAFTSKETTVFYIKVLDEYLDRAIELIMDIFISSRFPDEEIEKEKGIVVEEIRMVEDTPDDYVYDIFNEFVWSENGLGYNILGTEETVSSFRRNDLIEHFERVYCPDNIVFSCAGNMEFDRLTELLDGHSEGIVGGCGRVSPARPVFHEGVKAVEKDLSEVHICAGVEGIPQGSPDRYAMLLVNTILGSGVSSRLFQEIREKRGMAYSVYSFVTSYVDTGLFGVYVGTSKRYYREVIDLIKTEMTGFRDTVTEEELERARSHLKGNLILALESTSGRMNNLARQEIYYGRYYSPSEVMDSIDGVSLNGLRELADRLFSERKFAVTLLGPVEEAELLTS